MTPAELGVLSLALFAVFYFLGILATVTAFLGLVAVVLVGTQGWLGRTLVTITAWTQGKIGSITADALGAAFTGALTVVLVVIFIHDVHPKHSAGKRTAWIGVALGAVIVAGTTGIPALSGLRGDITHLATSVLHL